MTAVAHPSALPHARSRLNKPLIGRVLVYGALLFWVFVSLFPIYWTIPTSFKVAVDVTQGHLVPW